MIVVDKLAKEKDRLTTGWIDFDIVRSVAPRSWLDWHCCMERRDEFLILAFNRFFVEVLHRKRVAPPRDARRQTQA